MNNMLLVQYKTQCANCDKELKVYKSSLDVIYKKKHYGLNLCEACRTLYFIIDLDKIIKLLEG